MVFIFTGDLYLGNRSIKISEEILEIINAADYVVTNFESVLEVAGLKKREDKNAILQFNTDSLENYFSMVNSKIIFTLGNNHIHDLGEMGLIKTQEVLDKYSNVQLCGAGRIKDVQKPLIIDGNAKKIAILPVSTSEPEVMSKIATEEKIGVLDYNNYDLPKIISDTKESVDHLIMIPHWGKEFIKYPAAQLRSKAYDWLKQGADLVIGHHPHVIQGKEIYHGKSIYYSLGNFIFPNFVDKNGTMIRWQKNNSKSVMLKIDFESENSICEIGLIFDTKKNTLVQNKESLRILDNNSSPLNTINTTIKNYFVLWEKEYIETFLKAQRKNNSIYIRMIRKLRGITKGT